MEFFLPELPIYCDKVFLSSWSREGIVHMGILFSSFSRKKTGQSAFLTPAVFQMFLTQNNPWAKVSFCRVAYSATLQGKGHTKT